MQLPLEAFNVQIFGSHAHGGAVTNVPRLAVFPCVCGASMFARGQQGQSTELWLSSQISPTFDGEDSPQSGARPNGAPLFLLQGEKFTAGSLLWLASKELRQSAFKKAQI